jgi:DNA-binding NarL/FixJ family response regulator
MTPSFGSQTALPVAERKRVLICESQPVTAEGLRALLAHSPTLVFVKAVDSLTAAAEQMRIKSPSLVVLDKSFGIQAILKWIAEMRPDAESAAIVVWGSSVSEAEALRLLQGGVRGIIRKSATPDMMIRCLEAVASGSSWMEETLFRDQYRSDRYPQFELTPREQQVLDLVEQGLKNKEIANDLGIRPGTVKVHLKHIFEKTGVRGRYGLALSGLREKGSVSIPRVG